MSQGPAGLPAPFEGIGVAGFCRRICGVGTTSRPRRAGFSRLGVNGRRGRRSAPWLARVNGAPSPSSRLDGRSGVSMRGEIVRCSDPPGYATCAANLWPSSPLRELSREVKVGEAAEKKAELLPTADCSWKSGSYAYPERAARLTSGPELADKDPIEAVNDVLRSMAPCFVSTTGDMQSTSERRIESTQVSEENTPDATAWRQRREMIEAISDS